VLGSRLTGPAFDPGPVSLKIFIPAILRQIAAYNETILGHKETIIGRKSHQRNGPMIAKLDYQLKNFESAFECFEYSTFMLIKYV
jgi:hypothetical protein